MSGIIDQCGDCCISISVQKVLCGTKTIAGYFGFANSGKQYLQLDATFSFTGYSGPNLHSNYIGATGAFSATYTRWGALSYTGKVGVDPVSGTGSTLSFGLDPAQTFPYDGNFPSDGITTYSDVTDTSYTVTKLVDPAIRGSSLVYNTYTMTVTLSNEYTPSQLADDCDTLIASIDPSTVDNGTQKTRAETTTGTLMTRTLLGGDYLVWTDFSGGGFENGVGFFNGTMTRAKLLVQTTANGSYALQSYLVTYSGGNHPRQGSASTTTGTCTTGSITGGVLTTITPPAADYDTATYQTFNLGTC